MKYLSKDEDQDRMFLFFFKSSLTMRLGIELGKALSMTAQAQRRHTPIEPPFGRPNEPALSFRVPKYLPLNVCDLFLQSELVAF